jgi:spermidine/putrescine transport system permease protein
MGNTQSDGAHRMKDASYIERPNRLLGIYALVYLAFLYIPVLFLPLFSFNDAIYIAFPIKGFTTDWYKQMLTNEPMHASLLNSIKVGAATAVIATLLGIFGAKAVTRYRIPGQKPVIAVIMLPMVIPGIILGVALLILVSRLGIPLSLYTVTLGHILVSVPFSMATLIARFEGFDKSMEEAAADLGDNAWWTFWRVTFPMVFPGVLASLLLCFTISFDEFIMAFFLAGTEPTLPIFIWNQLRFPQKLPDTGL